MLGRNARDQVSATDVHVATAAVVDREHVRKTKLEPSSQDRERPSVERLEVLGGRLCA